MLIPELMETRILPARFRSETPSFMETLKRPTHAEIAALADKIYRDSGCIAGRDEENWLLAEAQLKQAKNASINRQRANEPKSKEREAFQNERNNPVTARH